MTERGILFSGAMVRALLDGSKTQTRRPVKGIDPDRLGETTSKAQWAKVNREAPESFGARYFCPYGQPGDRLWVRETWAPHPDFPETARRAVYRADPECKYDVDRWRPSIHMPRWASRILLEIVSVRVERLQDISDQDAIAEGIGLNPCAAGVYLTGTDETMPHAAYRILWQQINGAGSWDANPFVWVIEFRRIDAC